MKKVKKLADPWLRCLSVLLFAFFSFFCILPAVIRLHYGDVDSDQVLLTAGLRFAGLLPPRFLMFCGLLLLLWLVLCSCYAFLIFRGISLGLQQKLGMDRSSRRLLAAVNILLLGALVELAAWQTGVFSWPADTEKDKDGNFITAEEQYFPVSEAVFQFPEQKRNLIHIVCSSLDELYAAPELWGKCLIPDLVRLAAENDFFSRFLTVRGTDTTAMALYASQTGMPFKRQNPIRPWRLSSFRPEPRYDSPSLFSILKKQGYQTLFLYGGDSRYSGMERMYERFAGTRIADGRDLRREGAPGKTVSPVQLAEDKALLERLRRELTAFQDGKSPFAVQALLTDAWHGGPLKIPAAPGDNPAICRIIRNQNRILMEFIEWLKQQPYFRNTVVVLTGDCMGQFDRLHNMGDLEDTALFSCFLNSVAMPGNKSILTLRPWTMFDLMPSLLEAMGVVWQNHRLGFGVSIFSEENTWLEQIEIPGYEQEWKRL